MAARGERPLAIVEPQGERMLPTAARQHLGELVTEVLGVAKALRAEIVIVGDDEDYYDALSKWVDRIAEDLASMECRAYPVEPTEARP